MKMFLEIRQVDKHYDLTGYTVVALVKTLHFVERRHLGQIRLKLRTGM